MSDWIAEGQCPGGIVSHVHYQGVIVAVRPIVTDADLVDLHRFTATLPGSTVVSFDGDTGERIDLTPFDGLG